MSSNNIEYRLSVASLPLQMTLYYNCSMSILFICLMASACIDKALKYNYKIGIAVLIPWGIIEFVRLFYGYRGNLNEKVPDLSSFLLISIFPQFPMVIFLGFVQGVKYPVDNILGSIMIIFLVLGFMFGIQAMKQQIRSQTSQFMRIVGNET